MTVVAELLREGPIALREAVERLPRGPDGRPLTVSAITKWADPNRNGPILETIKIGNRLFTTAQAIERFIVAKNEARIRARPPKVTKVRSNARFEREAERAAKALEKLGV